MDSNQTQTAEAAPKAERKSLGVVFLMLIKKIQRVTILKER